MTSSTHSSSPVNPYEAVPIAEDRRRNSARHFKRFVVALSSFFIAFWVGAIAVFICVVLHERGVF